MDATALRRQARQFCLTFIEYAADHCNERQDEPQFSYFEHELLDGLIGIDNRLNEKSTRFDIQAALAWLHSWQKRIMDKDIAIVETERPLHYLASELYPVLSKEQDSLTSSERKELNGRIYKLGSYLLTKRNEHCDFIRKCVIMCNGYANYSSFTPLERELAKEFESRFNFSVPTRESLVETFSSLQQATINLIQENASETDLDNYLESLKATYEESVLYVLQELNNP